MAAKDSNKSFSTEFLADSERWPELTVVVYDPAGMEITKVALRKQSMRSGSHGYSANDKVNIGGERFQVGINLTNIGSQKRNTGVTTEPGATAVG